MELWQSDATELAHLIRTGQASALEAVDSVLTRLHQVNPAVNAVVRVPVRKGSVHDHADAWVLYGLLDGTESLERYDRIDDGSKPDYADVRLASVTTGTQGKVDLVPPRAIHAEQGGHTRSVAIIVRSQKLGQGTVLQGRYDPAARTRTEGYGPTQVPYELVA